MVKPIDYAALTERKCSKCKTIKAVSEFNRYDDPKQPINGWRYYAWCRECQNQDSRDYGTNNKEKRNARLRAWRKSNPEAARAKDKRTHIKTTYGLTEEQVRAMFATQQGRCLMCREEKPLVIDHHHGTGRVRGGLCNRCNTFIGHIEGNPGLVEAAQAYLSAKCPGVPLFRHVDVLLNLVSAAQRGDL